MCKYISSQSESPLSISYTNTMDLSTAYRYNQNMMEYYTCKSNKIASPILRRSINIIYISFNIYQINWRL